MYHNNKQDPGGKGGGSEVTTTHIAANQTPPEDVDGGGGADAVCPRQQCTLHTSRSPVAGTVGNAKLSTSIAIGLAEPDAASGRESECGPAVSPRFEASVNVMADCPRGLQIG